MPRTALTIIAPKGPHPGTVSANDLDFSFEAADVANKNKFSLTGKEIIIIKNADGAGAHNFTLTSVNGPLKRLGTITNYSLGQDEYAVFMAGDITGWIQTDGKFYLEADNNNIQFAIIKIPD